MLARTTAVTVLLILLCLPPTHASATPITATRALGLYTMTAAATLALVLYLPRARAYTAPPVPPAHPTPARPPAVRRGARPGLGQPPLLRCRACPAPGGRI